MSCLAALVLLALVPLLSGGIVRQANCAEDYSRSSQVGNYVFVMLAREDVSPDNPAGCVRRDEALRSRYEVSGLYTTQGAAVAMWTVDWYAPAVTVSGDGRHLVRWGPLAPEGNYSALAFAIYDSGREMASYSVDRLVAFPFMLPVIDGRYTWVHEFQLHEETDRLTFATELGERYTFDIATGQPVSNWVPPFPRYLVAAGAVLTLLVSLPVLIFAARRKPQSLGNENILRRNAG